jgi:hypothetical protein
MTGTDALRVGMGLLKQRGGSRGRPGLHVFHAADIRGADLCWRKFVGASRFYGADAVTSTSRRTHGARQAPQGA